MVYLFYLIFKLILPTLIDEYKKNLNVFNIFQIPYLNNILDGFNIINILEITHFF